MKTPVLLLSATALATASLLASATETVTRSEAVTVHSTDFSGKPPYRRSRAELEVTDVAKLEPVATFRDGARQTNFSGRPPFVRKTSDYPLVDIARLDIVSETEEAPRYRSRFAGRTQGARVRAR